MFGFLLVLLLLVGAFMTVIVLLQAGKGGGLASMGGGSAGTDSVIGGRQAATLLTKATWVSGGLFMGLALVLSILSSRQNAVQESILRGLEAPPTAPAGPALPGGQPLTEQPAPTTVQPAPTTGQ